MSPQFPEIWRYARSGKYFGWYVAFLDSSGCLAVLSDYGDYSYRWNPLGFRDRGGFREFISGCDPDYILGKIARRDFLNVDKTLRNIRDDILGDRRQEELSRDRARELWDSVPEPGVSEYELWMWFHDWGYSSQGVYDYPQQVREFMNRVWPEIVQALKKDIQSELDLAARLKVGTGP